MPGLLSGRARNHPGLSLTLSLASAHAYKPSSESYKLFWALSVSLPIRVTHILTFLSSDRSISIAWKFAQTRTWLSSVLVHGWNLKVSIDWLVTHIFKCELWSQVRASDIIGCVIFGKEVLISVSSSVKWVDNAFLGGQLGGLNKPVIYYFLHALSNCLLKESLSVSVMLPCWCLVAELSLTPFGDHGLLSLPVSTLPMAFPEQK